MNEFKKRLSIKLGVFLILIITLLLTEIFIGRTIAKDRDDIIAKKNSRQIQLENTETFLSLNKDKEEADKAITILTNALPDRDGVFSFKSDVERFGANYGISATLVFSDETLGGGNTASKIQFTIGVSGDFTKIMNFLKDLENSRYFTKFKSMELSSQGQSNDYQLTIVGELLFRP